jgi:hypothetical protein
MQTSPAQQLADKLGDIWQLHVDGPHCEEWSDGPECPAYSRTACAIALNPDERYININQFMRRYHFVDEVRLDDRTYCGPLEVGLSHNAKSAYERYSFVNGVAKLNPPINVFLLPGIFAWCVRPFSYQMTFVCGKLNNLGDCYLLSALLPNPKDPLSISSYLTTWSPVRFRSSTAPVKQPTLDVSSAQQHQTTLTEQEQQQQEAADNEQATASIQQQANSASEQKQQQKEAETKQTASASEQKQQQEAGVANNETQTTTLLAAPDMQTSEAQRTSTAPVKQPTLDLPQQKEAKAKQTTSASEQIQQQEAGAEQTTAGIAQQLADKLGDIWQLPVSPHHGCADWGKAAYDRWQCSLTLSSDERLINIPRSMLRYHFIDEVRLDDHTYCGPCEFRLENGETFATERYNFVNGVAKLNPPIYVQHWTGIKTQFVRSFDSRNVTFVCGYLHKKADRNLLEALVPHGSLLTHYLTTWSTVQFRSSTAPVKRGRTNLLISSNFATCSPVQFRSSTAPIKQPTLDLPQQQKEAGTKQTTSVSEQEQQQELNVATDETQPTTLLATVQALQENDKCARVLAEKRAELTKLLSQYCHSELVQHANMHQELSEQNKLTKTAQEEAKAASAKYAAVMSVLQSLVPAAP